METAFTYGGKALSAITLDDGDLLIEGFCALFSGLDRQNEQFAPGSFARGIKAFLSGPASLCYHHKTEKLLGRVLSLREIPGVGVMMRARVDGAIRKHPELGTLYAQIKNGSLSGLSVAGFFRRKMTVAGQKITDLDITEISCTPVSVGIGTQFDVIDGKALEYAIVQSELGDLEWLHDQLVARESGLEEIKVAVARARLGISSRR